MNIINKYRLKINKFILFLTKKKKSKSIIKITLQSAVNFDRFLSQSEKQIAEPQNSNDKSVANSSTPILNRAFFVRSTRISKISLFCLFSMVACSGKGFALCCVPLIAVSEPVTRYRPQASELQAVASQYLFSGAVKMFTYLFAGIIRTDLTNQIHRLRIQADSELQARAMLARDYILVFTGKISQKNLAKNNRIFGIKEGK